MELGDVLARRRTCRAFRTDAVADDVAESMVAAALRAPSAGNTDGWAFVTLEGPVQTARYWDATLPVERRDGFAWPGLLRAPLLFLPLCRPAAWVERYAEPDKRHSGLGVGEQGWPVPYWWVDTAFATMLAQAAAIDRGLGVCFFGQFDHEPAAHQALGVPDGWRSIGTVAVGWPDPDPAAHRAGRSAARPRPSVASALHRGRW